MRALALLPLLACKGKAAPCALDLPPFSIDCEGDRLQITHAGTPLFQGEAGWLEAGEGSPTVEAARGSFTFDDTTLSRCAGLTGSALVEEGDGAVLTAELGDCGAQVELQIERVNEETLRLSLELDGAPEINRIQLTSDAPEDERVTGFGAQYNHLDLKGQAVPIWCQEQGIGRGLEPLSSALGAGVGNPAGDALTTYTCVPWALSTAGYGWLSHASAYTVFDLTEPEQTTLSTWQSSLTLDLFAGEDPAALVEALTAVTGRMAPLPEWSQQGPIVRIGGGSEAVRTRLAAYVDAGVPVSAVWIEDWCGLRETSFGDRIWWNWVVDRARYPDWEDLVAELRADDRRVLVYLNPYVTDAATQPGVTRNLYAEALAAGLLVTQDDGSPYLIDQSGFFAGILDLSNPEAAALMSSAMADVLATGVEGWMADFAEGLPFEGVQLASGEDPALFHNTYPRRWAALVREAAEAAGAWEDGLFFHRSGDAFSPGEARAFWLGDQLVTWDAYDGFATVPPALVTSGLSGYALQHADTGGYLSVAALGITRSEELLLRWFELSAVSPLFRMHNTNQPEDNWQSDADAATLAAFAQASATFIALAPERARLMEEAAATGLPLMRHPLYLEPDAAEAWAAQGLVMLGSDVLFAPVLVEGATTVSVYLPAGDWLRVPTGEALTGGSTHTVSAPLGSPALFVRAGSAVAGELLP